MIYLGSQLSIVAMSLQNSENSIEFQAIIDTSLTHLETFNLNVDIKAKNGGMKYLKGKNFYQL